MPPAQPASSNRQPGARSSPSNRKARHDYAILDTYEAGLVLTGTEVKSLRLGRASLVDGFATIDDGEVFLRNVHIAEYDAGQLDQPRAEAGAQTAAAPRRDRPADRQDQGERAHAGAALALLLRGQGSRSSWHSPGANAPTTSVRTWPAATPTAKCAARSAGAPRECAEHAACRRRGPGVVAAARRCPAWSMCTCTSCRSR